MGNSRTFGVVIVALAVAFVVFYGLRYAGVVPGASGARTEGYQAVFLSNGQVYFGKITSSTPTDVTIEDIYYLQVEGQIQPERGQQPRLSLVKLGNELHAPQDKMVVNREHVLFWENLKDDGKVVTAIKDHKAGKTPPAAPAPATPPATTPTTPTTPGAR